MIFPRNSMCIREIRAIRGLSDLTLPWPAEALAKAATLQLFPNFPRHLSPDFLQYIDERPEMTSPWHAGASAKAAR